MSNKVHDEKKERCVFCGEITDIDKETPIERRAFYVVGAGQLCADCCHKIYHTDDLRGYSEP